MAVYKLGTSWIILAILLALVANCGKVLPPFDSVYILSSILRNETSNDTDAARLVLIQTNGPVNLAETAGVESYSVELAREPSDTVRITATADSQALVQGVNFVDFNSSNWNIPFFFTINAIDDPIAEGPHLGVIRHSSSSANDPVFDGTFVDSVSAQVADNDTPGVTIIESLGSTDVVEGGATDTYSVVLNTQPSDDVFILITTDGVTTVDGVVSEQITFTPTPGDWNNPRVVTVAAAANDNIAENPIPSPISHVATSVSDADYNGFEPPNVVATLTDDDAAGVSISQTAASTYVTESTGYIDRYSVILTSQPTANVSVNISGGTQTNVAAAPPLPALPLVFTPTNWNTPQTILVTGVDDAINEGPHTGTLTHGASSTDPMYQSISINNLIATICDNEGGNVCGPTDISGMTLWLKATDLSLANDSPVVSWVDASGSGNTVTQSTALSRPHFETNVFGTMPALRFGLPYPADSDVGLNDYLTASAFSMNSFTVFVVFSVSSGAPDAYIYSLGTNPGTTPGNILSTSGADSILVRRGGSTSSKSAGALWAGNGTPHIVGHVYNGTHASHLLYLDGLLVGLTDGSGIASPSSAFSNSLTIGARNNGVSSQFDGYIAEILIFDTSLSASNRAVVECYLNSRYSLTVSGCP